MGWGRGAVWVARTGGGLRLAGGLVGEGVGRVACFGGLVPRWAAVGRWPAGWASGLFGWAGFAVGWAVAGLASGSVRERPCAGMAPAGWVAGFRSG